MWCPKLSKLQNPRNLNLPLPQGWHCWQTLAEIQWTFVFLSPHTFGLPTHSIPLLHRPEARWPGRLDGQSSMAELGCFPIRGTCTDSCSMRSVERGKPGGGNLHHYITGNQAKYIFMWVQPLWGKSENHARGGWSCPCVPCTCWLCKTWYIVLIVSACVFHLQC